MNLKTLTTLLATTLLAVAQTAPSIRISQLHRVDATQAEVRWTVKGDASAITAFQLVRTPNGGTGVTNTILLAKLPSSHRALTRETTYTHRDVVPEGHYTYKVRALVGETAQEFSEPVTIKP